MKRVKIGKDAALEFEEAAAWYEKEECNWGQSKNSGVFTLTPITFFPVPCVY
jgi:hypothetical protein